MKNKQMTDISMMAIRFGFSLVKQIQLLICTCGIFILFFASPAHAHDSLPSFQRIISYEELNNLSKTRRQAYLTGLREMLTELEKSSDYANFSAPIYLQLMATLLIEKGQAADSRELFLQLLSHEYPSRKGNIYSCPLSPVTIRVGHNQWACLHGKLTTNKCPRGFVGVDQNPHTGQFFCISQASWQRLSKETQLESRASKYWSYNPTNKAKAQFDASSPDPNFGPLKISKAQLKDLAEKYPSVRQYIVNSYKAKTSQQEKLKITPSPPVTKSAISAKPEVARTATVSDKKREPSQESTSTESLSECSPDQELPASCSSGNIEKARRQYEQDPEPFCIYAGGISRYKDGQKRSFACAAPFKFCLSSPDCTNNLGEPAKADFECPSDQVICNPLIFGLQEDGKSPFCVSKQSQATQSCDQLANTEKSAVHPLLSTGESASGWKNTTGLREAWNEFANRINRMCHENKTAKVLQCRECHVIKQRLFNLNKAARNISSCGQALQYEERHASPEPQKSEGAR